MRPAMRLGDAKIGQQEGGCLGLHRSAAIGVQRQLTGGNAMLGERLVKQRLEQNCVFSIGDTPADDAAAEDIEDDVPLCANDDETPAPFEFRLGHRRPTSWLCPTTMAQPI